jgi:hypothetical protein
MKKNLIESIDLRKNFGNTTGFQTSEVNRNGYAPLTAKVNKASSKARPEPEKPSSLKNSPNT